MKKKFTTTLEDETIKDLKIAAVEEGRDANEILEELLQKYFLEREGWTKK